MNAQKHGAYSAEMRDMRRMLREQEDFLNKLV